MAGKPLWKGFCLLVVLTLSARAWQPDGWTYGDWPWAYDPASGDWYWFSPGGAQWIYTHPPGNGWGLLQQSGLAHGWSYWGGDWAYDGDTGAWCWRNAGDTQWCVNMRTTQWSLLGRAVASGLYLVVDLSGGPSAATYPVGYLDTLPAGGWTDEYKTTKLVLRRIPAGTFTMGSPEGELGASTDEAQHQVTLTRDFYIGVFEMTQQQWELVVGDRPSYFYNTSYYQTRPVEKISYYRVRENPLPVGDYNYRGSAISPNWPQSNQVHADSFMGRLRAKTGMATFDLPTEAQWEHACRAGTTTALNSGRNLTATDICPNMAEVGRYWFNGGQDFYYVEDPSAGTARVGSYPPNAWGLYDMHGNVGEYCLDWYGAYPGNVQDPPGAASGTTRVVRGGSYGDDAGACRSAARFGFYTPDYHGIANVGFRVATSPP